MISAFTVGRVRNQRINERPRPGLTTSDSHRVLDAPEGHADWSFADGREHLPRDGAPDTQKNELKPWKKKEWCIPEVSGEFVARMEDRTCTTQTTTRTIPWSVSTRHPGNWWPIRDRCPGSGTDRAGTHRHPSFPRRGGPCVRPWREGQPQGLPLPWGLPAVVPS